ncbi:alpha/beta-hydrolase [Pluteus cervinus]|uniref:Alpha/beta-hydrolase n=1 Tax=Pluteus cervinus TaxID=181527 RepID=A0ACD3A755_9AGAR|nr:alpha/beta-hydrolase [Pluteus cervinus]
MLSPLLLLLNLLASPFGVHSITAPTEVGAEISNSVTLDYGTFNGLINEDTKVIYFRGIRFADPPVGDLRWRAAVSPPTTHLGDVDATQFANACIPTSQTGSASGSSEDCLFGNVNIPLGTKTTDRLPVMVWFYGGGFQSGSTNAAPPDFILDSSAEPMIFASFAYRLGQFGFLGGSKLNADGLLNAGLHDQRIALGWVQKYIQNFGGDITRVTIWGQSAGAGSTMFHLIANGGDPQGLFRAAMGDSPSLSFTPFFNESYVENIFDQVASFAGCDPQAADAISCLRSVSSGVLATAGSLTIASRTSTLFTFAPLFDQTFLTMRPIEAFNSGNFAHVPVLFGSNTNEGAVWSSTLPNPDANTSTPNATLDTVFNFLQGQYFHLTRESFDQAVAQFYPLESFNGSFSLLGQQMYGEARYICTAVLITSAGGNNEAVGNSYQYRYDNPHLGSNHAAELSAFYTPNQGGANAQDEALFETMRELWSSFVTGLKPVVNKVTASSVSWQPIARGTGGVPRILLNPDQIAIEEASTLDPLIQRCNFWHSISDQLGA